MNIIEQDLLTFKKKYIDVTNEMNMFDVNLLQYKLNIKNICDSDQMLNLLLKLEEQKYCVIIKEKLKLFLLEPYSLFAKFKKLIFDKLYNNSDNMVLNIEKHYIRPFRNEDYETHYSCINDTSYKSVYNLIKNFYDSFDLYDIQAVNNNVSNQDYVIFKNIFGDNNVRNELIHCVADLDVLPGFDEELNTYTLKLMFNELVINNINLCDTVNAIYNFSQNKYIQFVKICDYFNKIMSITIQYDNKNFYCFRFNASLNKMQKFWFNVCCEYTGDSVDDVQDYSKYKITINNIYTNKYNNVNPMLLYFIDPQQNSTHHYDLLYNGIKIRSDFTNVSNLRDFCGIFKNGVYNNYHINYYNKDGPIDIHDNMLNLIKKIEELQFIPTFVSNHKIIKNMYNRRTIYDYYTKTKNINGILNIYTKYNACKSIDPLLEIYVDSKNIDIGNLIINLIESGAIYFWFHELVLESFDEVRNYLNLISQKCLQLKNDNNTNDFIPIINKINDLQYSNSYKHLYNELKQMFHFLF